LYVVSLGIIFLLWWYDIFYCACNCICSYVFIY